MASVDRGLDSPEYFRLLSELRELKGMGDAEIAHSLADKALLAFIDDKDVTDAFNAVPKWYA